MASELPTVPIDLNKSVEAVTLAVRVTGPLAASSSAWTGRHASPMFGAVEVKSLLYASKSS